MKEKPISATNRHRKSADEARRNRVRSLASSTAIETGEPIKAIEKKLNHPRDARTRVTLY